MENTGETLTDMPFYKIMKSLKAIGSASYDETELISKTKSITLFDKTKGDLSLISAFQHQPETSKALELIPESPVLFSWNNFFYLDQMLISITDDERQSVSDGLFEVTGVSLDDLVSATGNEIAFFVNQVNFGGLFPVPDFSCYLKVTDKTIVDKLVATGLEMVKAQGGMNVETEDIDGVSYQYFPIPYGSDITPGFTYIDDYFVISMNSKTVKSMLNARTTGAHVLKNSGINTVSKADLANNSVAYMDIIKGCDTLKNIGGWGSNMIGFAGAEAVDEYKVITEKVVYPILDALKMYESLGVRYWTEEDTFTGEFRVKSAVIEKTE